MKMSSIRKTLSSLLFVATTSMASMSFATWEQDYYTGNWIREFAMDTVGAATVIIYQNSENGFNFVITSEIAHKTCFYEFKNTLSLSLASAQIITQLVHALFLENAAFPELDQIAIELARVK